MKINLLSILIFFSILKTPELLFADNTNIDQKNEYDNKTKNEKQNNNSEDINSYIENINSDIKNKYDFNDLNLLTTPKHLYNKNDQNKEIITKDYIKNLIKEALKEASKESSKNNNSLSNKEENITQMLLSEITQIIQKKTAKEQGKINNRLNEINKKIKKYEKLKNDKSNNNEKNTFTKLTKYFEERNLLKKKIEKFNNPDYIDKKIVKKLNHLTEIKLLANISNELGTINKTLLNKLLSEEIYHKRKLDLNGNYKNGYNIIDKESEFTNENNNNKKSWLVANEEIINFNEKTEINTIFVGKKYLNPKLLNLIDINPFELLGVKFDPNIEIYKNFIFYGAAGAGKSFIAKYIASRLQAPTIVVNSEKLKNKYYGGMQKIFMSKIDEIIKLLKAMKKDPDLRTRCAANGINPDFGKAVIIFEEASSLLITNTKDGINKDFNNFFKAFLSSRKAKKYFIFFFTANEIGPFDEKAIRDRVHAISSEDLMNMEKSKYIKSYVKKHIKKLFPTFVEASENSSENAKGQAKDEARDKVIDEAREKAKDEARDKVIDNAIKKTLNAHPKTRYDFNNETAKAFFKKIIEDRNEALKKNSDILEKFSEQIIRQCRKLTHRDIATIVSTYYLEMISEISNIKYKKNNNNYNNYNIYTERNFFTNYDKLKKIIEERIKFNTK